MLCLAFLAGSAQAGQVALDVTNADIVPIIKRLAKEAGLNVYISPEVRGTVTLKIRDAAPLSALDLVLSLQEQKYRYKVLKNTLVVATPEKLQQIPDNLFGR